MSTARASRIELCSTLTFLVASVHKPKPRVPTTSNSGNQTPQGEQHAPKEEAPKEAEKPTADGPGEMDVD